MKHFLKVFSIAFLFFMISIGSGMFMFTKYYNAEADLPDQDVEVGEQGEKSGDSKSDEGDLKPKDPFEKAVEDSDRVNVLLLGMEGPRTDTIIFASFDPKAKKVDMISIPRDTYYHDSGYDAADLRKLNAKYGRHGYKGIMKAVENILKVRVDDHYVKVPVDHYVSVTYDGVEDIVDTIGGVEVDVPFHMVYEDTTPGYEPLFINIPEGRQTLDGEDAVKFLRFRKSNDGKSGYSDGDLGRVRAQQDFVKSAIKKSLSLKLPVVAKKVYDSIKTDMALTDMLKYAAYGVRMDLSDIDMTVLPGRANYKRIGGRNLSYFFHDPNQLETFIKELYSVEEVSEPTEE